MAAQEPDQERRPAPARPLVGYRDVGEDVRHSRSTMIRAWVILAWLWQYRSTRQKAGIYPIDNFAGYTTELAGPATFFFLALTVLLTAFAVAIIVGHLVWGQKF